MFRNRTATAPAPAQPTDMMRIAIAGGGGLANVLARELSQGAHALLEHPEFDEYDCQVAVVDYDDVENLRFTLQGVDLVISTVGGTSQINLIDAARRARVRCFVPSEFEGSLRHRPSQNDPLDRGSAPALDYLGRWAASRSHPMRYTVFACGVFYERFAPGGLAAYNLGAGPGGGDNTHEGAFLVDLGRGTAEIPAADAAGRPVGLSLTSVYDVARFVAAAVDLGVETWPREFRLRGAHLSTRRLVEICGEVRGVALSVIARPYDELLSWVQYYEDGEDWEHWRQMQQLVQTANGRYHFSDTNLNALVDVQTVPFRLWLQGTWGPAV